MAASETVGVCVCGVGGCSVAHAGGYTGEQNVANNADVHLD